jgi:hypothetical protein
MALLVGTRPRVRIPITPPASAPTAVVTDLKVIVKDPSGDEVTYDAPNAALTELDDNDWVWEAPSPLTEVGKWTVYVRTTSGIEGAAQLEFVLHGIGVTYA